ncbi:MAG: hypothetical protein QOE86_2722, partial [Solirubrobacteraceae bacterium]|nr:hypothetical protein [Solirubrobacteraceae bacterium]
MEVETPLTTIREHAAADAKGQSRTAL